MLFSASTLLFLFNLAVASLLCAGVTLCVGCCYRALPKRHATLVVGLIACVLAIAIVGVGSLLSLGQFSSFSGSGTETLGSTMLAQQTPDVLPSESGSASEPLSGQPMAKPVSIIAKTPELPKRHDQTLFTSTTTIEEAPSKTATSEAASLWQTTLLKLAGLLPIVWLIGFLAFFSLRIRDWLRCRRLIRTSKLNDDQNLDAEYDLVANQLQLRRKPKLLVSDGLAAPIVVGVFEPVVIFPTDVDQLFSGQQLRSVLVHELSHVARKDHWVVGLQILATTLYWWNPLVWLISNKVAEVRELICDDIAVKAQNTPREYAQSIIAMAERVVCQTEMLAPLGISRSSASELERRIRRIISIKTAALQTQLNRWSIAGVSLFATALAIGLLFAQVPSENAHGMQTGESETSKQSVDVKAANKFGKPDAPVNRISGQVMGTNGQHASEAIVRIVGHKWSEIDATIVTDTDGRFDFKVHSKQLGHLRFWAERKNGDEIAFHRFGYEPKETLTEGIEIKLETTRTAEVDVVDVDGRPIVDAQVVLQLKHPNILQGYKTSDTGRVSVRLPTSERIESVAAWKNNAGFDYRIYALSRSRQADTKAVIPEFPAQQPERLMLEGVAPLTVEFVDDEDKPIAGVEAYPWLLQKKGAPDSFNLSFFAELFIEKANTAGSATFNWMPAWQEQGVTVWPRAEGYERPRGNYDPKTGDGKLQLQLNRLVPIRGQVVDSEANPVGGVEVIARGKGRGHNEFRASEWTDEAGQYELLVAPNGNYLLIARNEDSAAAALSGILVFPNQPLEDRDFQLRKPTRVFGRLLNERTQKSMPNERVIVYQYGTSLSRITDGELPNPDNERYSVQPVFVHDAMTNAKGEFEFQLGDGSYDIRPPIELKAEKFEINGQDELEFTVKTKVQDEVELRGRVISKSDGSSIKDARVVGVPRSHGSSDWQANTDSEGNFDVLRLEEPTYVHVVNADQSLAAIVEIGDMDREFEVQLEPVATAYGRLMDGKKPVADQIIRYGVNVPDEDNQTWSTRFGGSATTDSEGKFELKSLAPNWKYTVKLPYTPDGRIPHLTNVTGKSGELKDLGDLKKPTPYKPYVPPTFEERVESAFSVKGTPLKRLQRGLAITKSVNQHLLVVFGQPEDPAIRRLMDIRYNDKDFRSLRDDYLFMAIPTDQKRLEKANSLAKRLDVDLLLPQQNFYLVILDANGQPVATAGLDELTSDNVLSKEKLFALLRKHQTTIIDARLMFANALKQAAKENKRVLVQETATWCGPCHKLTRLLNSNHVWEKDYIWIKMDHRWQGAEEIMDELRDGAEGGIPWIAILDAQGKKLATSNDPKTGDNIGFPSEATGKKHFARMLNDSRQRMSDSEVQSLIDSIDSTK